MYVTERLALEEALSAKDKVIADLESERSAVEIEKLSLVSDLDRLNAELASTATERDVINVELEKAYTQVEELTDALIEAEVAQKEERELAIADVEVKAAEIKIKEMEALTTENSLLNEELSAANACIQKEEQQLQQLKEQSEDRVAELNARLEIIAQELTAQQKTIDRLNEEQKVKGDNSVNDNSSLIAEMNNLLEAKIDAEARVLRAETDSKLFQDQLSTYDRNTAEEQEIIMRVAEAEMESLKESLSSSREELEACQERERALAARCTELETQVGDKEECLVELDAELVAAALAVRHAEDALMVAEDARTAAMKSLEMTEGELAKVSMSSTSSAGDWAAVDLAHKEALLVKDQRIAHLELSKLTQEQMDKIKQLKEDHKKSRDDVKTLKKQLTQLKKAYDDLKDSSCSGSGPSASSSGAIAAAHAEIASLTAQLQDSISRLESVQATAKTLKEKIKDCSKQLQVMNNTKSYNSLIQF